MRNTKVANAFTKPAPSRELEIFRGDKLEKIPEFGAETASPLAVIERQAPSGSVLFFRELLLRSALRKDVLCKVASATAIEDIEKVLSERIPMSVQKNVLYRDWLNEMAGVTQQFCRLLNEEAVTFSLTTVRECLRYHIDSVPFRLLVTYAGLGTEILPDAAADRDAYVRGEGNEKIVRDSSATFNVGTWNVAVFRGEPDISKHNMNGILHRSPASEDNVSILMRLDHICYWELLKGSLDSDSEFESEDDACLSEGHIEGSGFEVEPPRRYTF